MIAEFFNIKHMKAFKALVLLNDMKVKMMDPFKTPKCPDLDETCIDLDAYIAGI